MAKMRKRSVSVSQVDASQRAQEVFVPPEWYKPTATDPHDNKREAVDAAASQSVPISPHIDAGDTGMKRSASDLAPAQVL